MVHPRHRSSSTKRMLVIDRATTSIQVRGFMRKLIRPFAEAQNKTAPKLVHNITLGLMQVGTARPHSHDAFSPLNLTASLIPVHVRRSASARAAWYSSKVSTWTDWAILYLVKLLFPNDQFRYQQTNFKICSYWKCDINSNFLVFQ